MPSRRREHDRACRCERADGGCAALAVQRLSRTRVQELAEEFWTVSTGTTVPVQPAAPRPAEQPAGRVCASRLPVLPPQGTRTVARRLVVAMALGGGGCRSPGRRAPGRSHDGCLVGLADGDGGGAAGLVAAGIPPLSERAVLATAGPDAAPHGRHAGPAGAGGLAGAPRRRPAGLAGQPRPPGHRPDRRLGHRGPTGQRSCSGGALTSGLTTAEAL